MLFAAFLLFVTSVSGGVHRRDLAHFDQNAVNGFLVPFRESVLHMVAVEWNQTITDSALLKHEMTTCSNHIKQSVQNCQVCTQAACSVDPSSPGILDYINLLNPYNFLKEPLNEIGGRLGDLVDLLGSGSGAFINSMADLGKSVGGSFSDAFSGLESGLNKVGGVFNGLGNIAVDTANTVGHGLTDVANSIGHGLTDAANLIGHGLTDAVNAVGHQLTDSVHGLGHLAGNIGNTIGSLIGKREIDPKVRHCMEQCPSCNTLLITNQRQMISTVCGEEVVKFNDTVRNNVAMVKGIFLAVSDKVHPVITKIEYDPTSLSGTTYNSVYLTVSVKGQYFRYKSHVPFEMMNLATTGRRIAAEYWKMWESNQL